MCQGKGRGVGLRRFDGLQMELAKLSDKFRVHGGEELRINFQSCRIATRWEDGCGVCMTDRNQGGE